MMQFVDLERIDELEARFDRVAATGLMVSFMVGVAKATGTEANFWDVLENTLNYAEKNNPPWLAEACGRSGKPGGA
jgi:hypothetical protein